MAARAIIDDENGDQGIAQRRASARRTREIQAIEMGFFHEYRVEMLRREQRQGAARILDLHDMAHAGGAEHGAQHRPGMPFRAYDLHAQRGEVRLSHETPLTSAIFIASP